MDWRKGKEGAKPGEITNMSNKYPLYTQFGGWELDIDKMEEWWIDWKEKAKVEVYSVLI